MVRQWLSGYPLESFLKDEFGLAPRMGLATAWGAAPLVDWRLVSGLLQAGAGVRMGRGGERWKGVVPRSMLEAHKRMREGWCLVLEDAQRYDEPLRRLAESVGAELGGGVRIEVTASPRGGAGFGWQRRAEELFLVQCCGVKTLHFRDHVQGSPRAWKLAPGDWLYLPSQWPYRGMTETDSLTLRVCVSYSPRAKRWSNDTKMKPLERMVSTSSSSRAMPPSVAASWGCQKKEAQASRTTAARRAASPTSPGVS
jgi:hypothetical protein